MKIKLLAICGLTLLIGSIGLRAYLLIGLSNATRLTDASYTNGCNPGDECLAPATYTSNLTASDSLISESQTVALTLKVSTNSHLNTSLKATLIAPEFHYEPSTPIATNSSNTTTLGWILSPTKPGSFQVGVQVEGTPGHISDTRYIGITVTNVFGLNPWQAQLLSYIGTLLGPILTLGWWYDKWQDRKRRKREEALTIAQGTISIQPDARSDPQQRRRARRKH